MHLYNFGMDDEKSIRDNHYAALCKIAKQLPHAPTEQGNIPDVTWQVRGSIIDALGARYTVYSVTAADVNGGKTSSVFDALLKVRSGTKLNYGPYADGKPLSREALKSCLHCRSQ